MVRWRAISLAAAAIATVVGGCPAAAEDWMAAGGDIFVPPPGAPASPPAEPAGEGQASRPSFAAGLSAAATREGLDPKLLEALVVVESAGRPDAVSASGAAGLTQLMPATARELQVGDAFDPAQNLSGGARFLARQISRFGDLRLALAAYNAGPELVARLGRVPAIPETQAYVDDVIACFLALTAGRRVASARDCRGQAHSP